MVDEPMDDDAELAAMQKMRGDLKKMDGDRLAGATVTIAVQPGVSSDLKDAAEEELAPEEKPTEEMSDEDIKQLSPRLRRLFS